MVTRVAVRLILGLLTAYAAVTALEAALWWSFDSGPLGGQPEIVLTEPSPTGAVRTYGDYPDLEAPAAAHRTVDRLEAAGGFERSVLVVTIPTGSGWVAPEQVSAIEAWADGDTATVAMRYSSAPSAVAYVLRPDLATVSAHALLTEVTDRLRALDPPDRPELIVHGLSLGAQAGTAALADLPTVGLVEAVLWQGLPGARMTGPAVERPCTVSAINPDDPVAELSWELLREPARAIRVLGALPGADSTAPGTGHTYLPVLPPAECVTPGAGDTAGR